MFATSQEGEIALVDLKSNKTTKLVTMNDVRDVRVVNGRCVVRSYLLQVHGSPLSWASWELSSDMKFMLIKSDHLKV